MISKLPQQILDQLSVEEKALYTVYNNAASRNIRDYNADATAARRKNLEESLSALREMVEDLQGKYGDKGGPANDERFRNRKQALDWLRLQGYKISQGKFYQDCAAGNPATARDGSLSRYHVVLYGQGLDVERRGEPESACYAAEKERLEVEKLRYEVARREMEARREDGRWMMRDDAWMAIAALLGTLIDSLRHHFHVNQDRLVYLAAGEHGRGPEVYTGCEEIMAAAFNEVSGRRIEGIFSENKEEKNNDEQ
jgi:hypothetical protein